MTGVAAGNLTVNGSAATAVSGSGLGPYLFTGFATPGNGLVTVALAAGSIQDGQAQPFAGDTWYYALTRRLVINEFLASNNTAAQDEYGEFDDYLEIYNPTDATVDMSGMFLTDDLDSKSQYRIPSGVTVPPHGHIVFWCDGQTSQGALHTNFNILRAGEDLGLFDTEENGLAPIDTLTFTTQTTDVASGRFPDGVDGFVSMPVTPGAANTITCSSSTECTALTNACNVGLCTGNRCVSQTANEGGACNDGVACTAPDTCSAGICNGGLDTCPTGQTCNYGTGICEAAQLDPLPITVGATWSYFKGAAEPTPTDLTAWTRLDYSDAGWLSGPSGFGYGTDCTAQTGTTLSDMIDTYMSVYLRKTFRVDDPARVTTLTLTVDYDDAFVAYLNGTEVARRNVAGTPPAYSQVATADHECSVCGGTCNAAVTIDISAFRSALVAGTNVLAIQAHNLTLGSSDFTLIPTLVSTEIAGCIYDSECNDNNPCTDDVCNLGTGVCTNPTDNTNPCTDAVACTTDSCSAGTCVSTDSCFGGLVCNHTSGACEGTPVTVTFQQDVAGYTGTQDTYLYQSGPDTPEGAVITWRWDTDDPPSSGLYEYGLVRFDGIFGEAAGQIPVGATISSATLTLYVENGTVTPAGSVNEAAVDWSEATTTWNNFGGEAGVDLDEYGALVAATPVTGASVSASISVTSSVQAWSDGLRANYGWIFRPAVTDGVAVTSSEGATPANRPKLSVTYIPLGQACADDGECQDGLWCNGAETCNLATETCEAGTPQACDDFVVCTIDSCNESTDSCEHVPNNATCNDGNVCTADTCNGTTGCDYAPNNGASCEDGNGCTTGDLCAGGTCTSGGATNCDDGLACTTDSCIAPTGCQHVDSCPGGQTCSHTTGLCSTAPATMTFQHGVNAYAGTVDTYIDAALGSQATTTPIVIDGSPVEQVLLRFDGLFGPGANQVPVGSTISSATLTLRVGSGTNDQSENAVNYHRLLHPWIPTDVWAAYGVSPWNATAGIQTDELDALAAIEASATMSTASTAYSVSVTGSVQAWANAPASNYGWVIVNVTGTDGLRLESSESTTVSYRPLLSITYTAPVASCTSDPQCDDGLFCNGAETCNLGTSTCQAGTPPCNDGVDCTTDSCIEATDSCDHAPVNAACDDSNVCTDDTCHLTLDCQHANNSASCSDGNACTTGDSCSGGTCTAGGATSCDDGIACTLDACNTSTGCTHADGCTGGLVCNHETGACETSAVSPLPIILGDAWRYFKGQSDPPAGWNTASFDDLSWSQGGTGIGFDYYVETGGTNGNGDYGPFIATELADMRGCTPVNPPLCNAPGYLSVYMRRAFWINDPARVTALSLKMYADDGYVAYINGVEVARLRLTGTPPAYNALATAAGPSGAPPIEQTLDLSGYSGNLVAGVNVLAVQAHNVALDSRDLLVIPQLSSTESGGCTSDLQCGDGLFCNGAETCNLGTSTCQAGAAPNCADTVSCTTDSCNETNDSCDHVANHAACSDGLVCDGTETCDPVNGCRPGTGLICDDGIACTTDSCVESSGCQHVDSCTGGQSCNHTSGHVRKWAGDDHVPAGRERLHRQPGHLPLPERPRYDRGGRPVLAVGYPGPPRYWPLRVRADPLRQHLREQRGADSGGCDHQLGHADALRGERHRRSRRERERGRCGLERSRHDLEQLRRRGGGPGRRVWESRGERSARDGNGERRRDSQPAALGRESGVQPGVDPHSEHHGWRAGHIERGRHGRQPTQADGDLPGDDDPARADDVQPVQRNGDSGRDRQPDGEPGEPGAARTGARLSDPGRRHPNLRVGHPGTDLPGRRDHRRSSRGLPVLRLPGRLPGDELRALEGVVLAPQRGRTGRRCARVHVELRAGYLGGRNSGQHLRGDVRAVSRLGAGQHEQRSDRLRDRLVLRADHRGLLQRRAVRRSEPLHRRHLRRRDLSEHSEPGQLLRRRQRLHHE